MKKTFFIIVSILALLAVSILISLLSAKQEKPASLVEINNAEIKVDLAKTSLEQYKGLSGRESLCPNCGMLFIFKNKDEKTFVMRDMMFPLDIIWINDRKIVKIDRNLQPENSSNLTNYQSEEPVNYVMEVNAGFCEKNNIKIGDEVKYLKI